MRALLISVAALGLAGGGCRDDSGASASSKPEDVRIVSAGGAVTEILYALGAGDRVVGVDRTSIFPAEARELPKVGMFNDLPSEGVLALKPTMLVATESAGPPETLEQLEAAGVVIERIPEPTTPEGAAERIRALAKLVGAEAKGEELAEALLADVEEAMARGRKAGRKPRTLFVYARGTRTVLVGGDDTPAADVIRMAGGENAAREVTQFKPLTAEGVVAADPEYILLPARGLDSLGGVDSVLSLPGVAQTRAGKAGNVIAVDDLALMGFGPRLPQALKALQDGWGLPQ